MHLINVETLELEYFLTENDVAYAILSHRWEDEEVLYEHMAPHGRLQHLARSRRGWTKVTRCCEEARGDSLKYVWIDTCCINKDSSAELQEAINSMFRWYADAKVCYAYLSDIPPNSGSDGFTNSRWFTRGWTLQELLAPEIVDFFDTDWGFLGTRRELSKSISQRTRIAERHLLAPFTDQHRSDVSVAEIMSWAAGRNTSRPEDRAYSLLGLVNVNMPMLYGEGENAFIRLQQLILSTSNDQSLFAWGGTSPKYTGLLASSPDSFQDLPFLQDTVFSGCHTRGPTIFSHEGVTSTFLLKAISLYEYRATLNVHFNTLTGTYLRVAIHIRRLDAHDRFICVRRKGRAVVLLHSENVSDTPEAYEQVRQITVTTKLNRLELKPWSSIYRRGHGIPHIRLRAVNHLNWSELTVRCTHTNLASPTQQVDFCFQRDDPGALALIDCHDDTQSETPLPFSKLLVGLDHRLIPTCTIFIDHDDALILDDLTWRANRVTTGCDESDTRLVVPKFSVRDCSRGKVQMYSAGILTYKPTLEEFDMRIPCSMTLDLNKDHCGLVTVSWHMLSYMHKRKTGSCWGLDIKFSTTGGKNCIVSPSYQSVSWEEEEHTLSNEAPASDEEELLTSVRSS